MNSKVLLNEEKIKLGNGIMIYYGSPNTNESNVISITVKGKFKPSVDSKDYKHMIKHTKEDFTRFGNKYVLECSWINTHYIFTTDFTECGITKNKTCKFKFQVYVSPIEIRELEYYRQHIIKIGEDMSGILEAQLKKNGFEFSN